MRKQMIAPATAIVLATAVYAGAASAGGGGGGGGAEPMPMTNFTDMPSYHPNPVRCPRWVKCVQTRSVAPTIPLLRLTGASAAEDDSGAIKTRWQNQ